MLEEKKYFYLLIIIPIVVLVFILLQLWKRNAQRKFANKQLLERLSPEKSTFKPILKLVIWCLAIASLTVALVNPKIGTKLETVKREGVDIVFAVDVSKSMLAEDISPSRLDKAKRIVSEIINNLGSDRIGIIAYAGRAVPQLPITTDFSAAKMFLANLNTDMLSSQGTAIDDAIRLAKTYYDDVEQTNRVLVIISDGEDHTGGAGKLAAEATKEGIKTYTIGVGTPKGGRIPLKRRGIVESYKRDLQGEVVITRLNENTLKNIAAEGDGEYIDGTVTEDAVSFITERLSTMNKTEFEAKKFSEYQDQFQWFLGLGIFLLLLDVFLLERKTAWLQKLNLFNEKES
ncbi:Ca-activated chloride channel family protein [Kordia periserrulae]|uniref:Ca-activated chloride channel family protein n=1 Tax=Kordia periserrulae TaxID=701523 RepID=A0A2T6BX72_9FLAO|nr:VWA domain-containing protein [Kordia periserrulae]PTX60636.1 Ca-activated chloride channel family protein [Kordia periserrulae]